MAAGRLAGSCQTKKWFFLKKAIISKNSRQNQKIMMLSNRRKCIKMRIFWIYQQGMLIVKNDMPFFVVPKQKARKSP